MPVIINKGTGLAENMPLDQATQALQQGTHAVPMVNPDGKVMSVDYKDAPDYANQNYTQPSHEVLNDMLKHAYYSSPEQQKAAYVEGVANSLTFGLSSGLERALGVDPEGMRMRPQVNPGATVAGNVAGTVGSMLTGLGEMAMVGRAGAATASAVGLAGAKTLVGKLAEHTVRGAAEMALIQGGDEVAKAFASDPDQSVQSIVSHIGLASALGGVGAGAIGGLGSAAKEALWESKAGVKVRDIMQGLRGKFVDQAAADIEKTTAENGVNAAAIPEGQPKSPMAEPPDIEGAPAEPQEPTTMGEPPPDSSQPGQQASEGQPEAPNGQPQQAILDYNAVPEMDGITADGLNPTGENADALAQASQDSGIQLPDSIKASISDNPTARIMGQNLEAAGTNSANTYRADLDNVKHQASNGIADTLGKTVDEAVPGKSINEHGANIRDTLAQEIGEKNIPVKEAYEPINKALVNTPLPNNFAGSLSEKLSNFIKDQGYHLNTGDENHQAIETLIKDLPKAQTVDNYTKQVTNFLKKAKRSGLYDMAYKVRPLLRDAEDSAVKEMVEKNAPQLIEAHSNARGMYKALRGLVDSLDDQLKVKFKGGIGSFVNSLKDMPAESFTTKLSGKSRADILSTLSEHFPKTAQAVREMHLDNLADKSTDAIGPRYNIHKFYTQYKGLSKELRDFVFDGNQQRRIEGIRTIVSSIPKQINPSGSGRVVDNLISHLPGGISTFAAGLAVHNPIISVMGHLLGNVAKSSMREGQDALRLGILRAIGSKGAVNPLAVKASVGAMSNAYRAAKGMDRAVSDVFKVGSKVGLDHISDFDPKGRETIKKTVKAAQVNPQEEVGQVHSAISHYMPDHAVAAVALGSRAVQYLNSIRPSEDNDSPLGAPRVPSAPEQRAYDRAVDLANHPTLLLEAVKRGTVTPQDIVTVSTIYPSLYKDMQTKVLSELTAKSPKDIPYNLRASLSMFLGSPLESSLRPQNMQVNGGIPLPGPTAPPPMQAPRKRAPERDVHKTESLSKLPSMSSTPEQARERSRYE